MKITQLLGYASFCSVFIALFSACTGDAKKSSAARYEVDNRGTTSKAETGIHLSGQTTFLLEPGDSTQAQIQVEYPAHFQQGTAQIITESSPSVKIDWENEESRLIEKPWQISAHITLKESGYYRVPFTIYIANEQGNLRLGQSGVFTIHNADSSPAQESAENLQQLKSNSNDAKNADNSKYKEMPAREN